MAHEPKHLLQIIDGNENTLLHKLAAHGAVDQLQNLCMGEKIDQQNYFGWTPLMVAARYGHADTVKILIEKRADATKTNKYDVSVFSMAVASGNLDVINYLLEYLLAGGISRTAITTCISPLSISILFQHEAVLNFLLVKRFPVNVYNIQTGLTPLMFAALEENQNIYELLLLNGAHDKFINAFGESAFDLFHRKIAENGVTIQSNPLIVITDAEYLTPSLSAVNNQIQIASNVNTPPTPPPTISPLVCPQIFFPQDFTNYGHIPNPTSLYNFQYVVSPFVTFASPASDLP